MKGRTATRPKSAEGGDHPVAAAAAEDAGPLAVAEADVMSNLGSIVSKGGSDSTPSVQTGCSLSAGSPADGTCTPQSLSSSAGPEPRPGVGDALLESVGTDIEAATCAKGFEAKQRFERLPSVGTWLAPSLRSTSPEEAR